MPTLNLFVYDLIYVYEIRSCDDIYSPASHFLSIKQISHKYYSKTLNIYINTLAKRMMSSALNFQLCYFSYIHQVSVFDINVKRN